MNLWVRISWQVLKKRCDFISCVSQRLTLTPGRRMVVHGCKDTKLKQGDQREAVTGVQAEVKGLKPSLGQWVGKWVGEKRQPENRQGLSRDSGREDYAATRWRLLRPSSAHFYPSPDH